MRLFVLYIAVNIMSFSVNWCLNLVFLHIKIWNLTTEATSVPWVKYCCILLGMNSMSVWSDIISTPMYTTNKMQQVFRLLIFLIQPYMFRATNSPILRSTFWLYLQLLV